jgi:hypothetical protein
MLRIFFTTLLLFLPLTFFAQLGGGSTYSFLRLPQSARIESLGGAATAIMDDDVAMAFQNPALLNPKMHNRIAVDANAYFAGIGYGSLSYARHYEKKGTFFAGIQYLDYGTFRGADETGQFTGNFQARDQAFYFGYGRGFLDSMLYLGASCKSILSQYEMYTSSGLAIDLGITFQSRNRRTHLSATASNIGFQLSTYTVGRNEPLPFTLNLGLSHVLEHLPLRLSVMANNLQQPDLGWNDPDGRFKVDALTGDTLDTRISFGDNFIRHFIIAAELMPFKRRLFLRLSYNFLRAGELSVIQAGGATGLSYGLGIKISHFTFSYGRSEYHPAGSPNHFSVLVNLDGFFSKEFKELPLQKPTGID